MNRPHILPFRLLLCLWLLCFALPSAAQRGLHVEPLFGSSYGKRKDATEVMLKGSSLKPYKLTLFRSLSFVPSAVEAKTVEQKVIADAKGAVDKETVNRKGQLYYGFYQLKPASGQRRYLIYRNNALAASPTADSPGLLLIYREGTATPQEVQSFFKKK